MVLGERRKVKGEKHLRSFALFAFSPIGVVRVLNKYI